MLRGPSGGGKTSLLNILGTIDRASAGRVCMCPAYEHERCFVSCCLTAIRLGILGREITEKSSDSFLSKLRLEKIGAKWRH